MKKVEVLSFDGVMCNGVSSMLTERSWVRIPPGAGFFSLLYPIRSVSSIRSLVEVNHYLFSNKNKHALL